MVKGFVGMRTMSAVYIVVAFYADLDGKYQLGLEKVKSVRFVFVEM